MYWTQLLFVILLCLVISNASANNVTIVIVGAGAAGIAAATKLLENSFTNIKILEAQNRIGGRIHSVEFANTIVDVGAQFCHGEEGNIVFQLAEKLDILQESNLTYPKIYDSDGNVVAPELVTDIVNTLNTYMHGFNISKNVSLGEAVLEIYNSTVLKKYSNDETKLKLARDAIRALHGHVVSYEGAFSWNDVSPVSHYEECEGNSNLSWKKRGYRIILDILMKSYPNNSEKLPIDDKILLNKVVQKIEWNGAVINIQSADNSSLTADHVIFTPSVGVMEEYKNTLFEPKLPKAKEEALEAIGFDGIMKIILHFPEAWWSDTDYIFSFLWTEEDLLKSSAEFPEGPQKDGISWITSISGFTKLNLDSNVWIGWVSFDLIPEIEQTSEDVILKGCNYIFRKFFGKHYNVTDADKVIRSQWRTNPYIGGTYSYLKFGYYDKSVSYSERLAEPLTNEEGQIKLLFAGEATNKIHSSTVHGAIESGRREAERLINLYK